MIPVREMRIHLEKNAGVAERIGKFIMKKPGRALAIAGAGALTLGAGAVVTGLGSRVHDVYNITSEMRKRRVMKNQVLPTLKEIAKNTKPEAPPAMPRKQKIIIPPLT